MSGGRCLRNVPGRAAHCSTQSYLRCCSSWIASVVVFMVVALFHAPHRSYFKAKLTVAMMNLDALWALGPLGLLVAVCLLWWFLSWVQQRHSAAAELSGLMAAMIVCCRILLVGILVLAFAASLFFGLIPGIVLGVVFLATLVRYRRSEVRYLIWNLAEAAQRGIPLETVARAFANEQHGTLADACPQPGGLSGCRHAAVVGPCAIAVVTVS